MVNDVSGQPIHPIFKDQAVQKARQEHLQMQLYSKWCGQCLVLRERDARQQSVEDSEGRWKGEIVRIIYVVLWGRAVAALFLDFLAPDGETDILSRNVCYDTLI